MIFWEDTSLGSREMKDGNLCQAVKRGCDGGMQGTGDDGMGLDNGEKISLTRDIDMNAYWESSANRGWNLESVAVEVGDGYFDQVQ